MQFHANLQDPSTKAAQEQVRKGRARKLGEKSKRAKALKSEEAKRLKEDHVAAILALPEIEGDFPCNLDLTIEDREEYRKRLEQGQEGVAGGTTAAS